MKKCDGLALVFLILGVGLALLLREERLKLDLAGICLLAALLASAIGFVFLSVKTAIRLVSPEKLVFSVRPAWAVNPDATDFIRSIALWASMFTVFAALWLLLH